MGMKYIYLAGAINGKTDAECKDWRDEATAIITDAMHIAVNPLSRDYRGRELENVRDIVHGDLTDIRKADAVVANCVSPSWGTAMEIRAAYSFSVPVFCWALDPSRCSPWLKYHAAYIADNMRYAVEAAICHSDMP